ncbi:MAG: SNF2 helicase associated domain-containing protein [Eggerthellaceae bacterium]
MVGALQGRRPQGSYVMKSISDFVGRMRRGERFSYGKKLAFTHVPAMLAESARPIARFLDRAVALREQATGSAFWRYRGRDEIGRDLDLSDYELIELLDLLDGRPFTVEGTDYGTRSLTRAHVVSADPDVEVSVRRTDDGGYAIEADELPFVAQGDRMYLWQGETFFRCSADFARTAGFLRTVYENDDARLFVSLADMPLFCATVLPAIEKRLHVETPTEIGLFRPVPCKLEFYFDKTDRDVTCDAQAVYGERRYRCSTPRSRRGGPLRDEAGGSRGRLVKQYFDIRSSPSIMLSDETAVADLVFGGLVSSGAGQAFTTPAFDRLLVDRSRASRWASRWRATSSTWPCPPTTCPQPRWRRCWRATAAQALPPSEERCVPRSDGVRPRSARPPCGGLRLTPKQLPQARWSFPPTTRSTSTSSSRAQSATARSCATWKASGHRPASRARYPTSWPPRCAPTRRKGCAG